MEHSVASNELAIFERAFQPLAPHFAQVLGNAMPVERLMRTVMISVEKSPQLLECDRQTLFNGAMTFAVLGLEVDGATGQGFLVPFNDRKRGMKVVQPIIGYKGYNTIGARSGLTIAGGVVREGDEFDYEEGSKAFVHHKRKLGGEKDRRILAAWSTATSNVRPAIIKVLSIDELNSIKQKSPRGGEPPWADHMIGFPAMCEKSAKRRLARDMPLNVFQAASRMEEAFEEQGVPSWISPERGVVLEGEITGPQINHDQRGTQELLAPRTADIPTAADYFLQWETRIRDATRAEHIGPVWNGDKQLHKQIAWTAGHSYEDLKSKVLRAVDSMRAPA
jgi:recombination protein RecT